MMVMMRVMMMVRAMVVMMMDGNGCGCEIRWWWLLRRGVYKIEIIKRGKENLREGRDVVKKVMNICLFVCVPICPSHMQNWKMQNVCICIPFCILFAFFEKCKKYAKSILFRIVRGKEREAGTFHFFSSEARALKRNEKSPFRNWNWNHTSTSPTRSPYIPLWHIKNL